MRCGTPGTSWHVTTKSSFCDWGVLYKSGVYAVKVLCLTLGARRRSSRQLPGHLGCGELAAARETCWIAPTRAPAGSGDKPERPLFATQTELHPLAEPEAAEAA